MSAAIRFAALFLAVAALMSFAASADNVVSTDNSTAPQGVVRQDASPQRKGGAITATKTDWNISKYPPCADDIRDLCQGADRGGGKIFNCLVGNIDAIKSHKCKARAYDLSFALKVILHECKDDIEALCWSDNSVAVLKCIDRNRSTVSEKCLDEFDDERRAKAVEQFVKRKTAEWERAADKAEGER